METTRRPKGSAFLTFVGVLLLIGGLASAGSAVVSALVAGGSISLDGVIDVANDDPAAWKRLAIVLGVLAVVLLIFAGLCLSAAGRRRRFRKNRPKSGHRMTTDRHWQGHVRAGTIVARTVGTAGLVVAGVLVAKQQDESSGDANLLIPAAIVGGFGLLFFAIGQWWRRELRARQRALALQSSPIDRPAASSPGPASLPGPAASSTGPASSPGPASLAAIVPTPPASPSPSWTTVASPAPAQPPPFRALLCRPRDLPNEKLKPLRLTATSNVVGAPPIEILYLRVFDNHERARTYAESAWREFGYVSLIRNAASISAKELRDGAIEAAMARSPADAGRAYAARPRGVDTEKRKKIAGIAFSTVRVRDPFGAYPVFSLFCHDTVWQSAVEMLLDHAGLVTMDLAGVDTSNPGSLYEIGRLFDRFPVGQVLFLVDERSDVGFIVRNLHDLWSRMAAESPNRHGPQTVHFVQTDHYRQYEDQNGNRTIALVADRKESRRLINAWATGRLHGNPVT